MQNGKRQKRRKREREGVKGRQECREDKFLAQAKSLSSGYRYSLTVKVTLSVEVWWR